MLANKAAALHAGIAMIVAILSVGCTRTAAVGDDSRTGTVRLTFDSGAWKNGAAARGKMAEDLIARGVLIGKARAEVKALLGEPDQEGVAFLSYFVFPPDRAAGPAYAIRVQFDPRADVVQDTRIDTDAGMEYAGAD